MPIIRWLSYADHALAPICRSVTTDRLPCDPAPGASSRDSSNSPAGYATANRILTARHTNHEDRVPRPHRSKQSTFREAEHITRSDNYVVNNFRIDQLQATHQPFRDHFVRVTLVVHG